MVEEYFHLSENAFCTSSLILLIPMKNKWAPPEVGTLKANTNAVFAGGKIVIGILIHNHLGIPLLVKSVPCAGIYSIDYGDLVGIIEGYSVGMALSVTILIDSDSLLAV